MGRLGLYECMLHSLTKKSMAYILWIQLLFHNKSFHWCGFVGIIYASCTLHSLYNEPFACGKSMCFFSHVKALVSFLNHCFHNICWHSPLFKESFLSCSQTSGWLVTPSLFALVSTMQFPLPDWRCYARHTNESGVL